MSKTSNAFSLSNPVVISLVPSALSYPTFFYGKQNKYVICQQDKSKVEQKSHRANDLVKYRDIDRHRIESNVNRLDDIN